MCLQWCGNWERKCLNSQVCSKWRNKPAPHCISGINRTHLLCMNVFLLFHYLFLSACLSLYRTIEYNLEHKSVWCTTSCWQKEPVITGYDVRRILRLVRKTSSHKVSHSHTPCKEISRLMNSMNHQVATEIRKLSNTGNCGKWMFPSLHCTTYCHCWIRLIHRGEE